MTFETFEELAEAPKGVSPLLIALWHEKQGDWDQAHEIAQDIETPAGAWVHAYLHWQEGDLWNADYWYRRAGRTRPNISVAEEWENIVRFLLKS
jgi:hypothetical protein